MRTLTLLMTSLTLLVSLAAKAAVDIEPGEYVVFYHHDVLGSPVTATNEQGQVLWHERTESYGKSEGRVSNNGNPFGDNALPAGNSRQGYTGHTLDSSAGLTYMKARYYDHNIGRFLSNDPVGFMTDNPMMFNRYAYAANSPYNYIDPDGRFYVASNLFRKDLSPQKALEISSVSNAAMASGAVASAIVISAITPGPEDLVLGAGVFRGLSALKKGTDTPDVKKRPGSFRKKTVEDSWDNAADGSRPGTKQCPTCGKDVTGNPHMGEKRNGQDGWDNDHQPKWKDRNLEGMDRKQVLDEYNTDTRLRCQSCNRADNQ